MSLRGQFNVTSQRLTSLSSATTLTSRAAATRTADISLNVRGAFDFLCDRVEMFLKIQRMYASKVKARLPKTLV